MKTWTIVMIGALSILPSVAHAARYPDTPSYAQVVWDLIDWLIPILLFLALMFLIIRSHRKSTQPYIERHYRHFEQVEEQNRKIIGLLEEMRDISKDKKQETTSIPPPLPK